MTDSRRARLTELTERWRERHDRRHAGREPEAADAEREERARLHFPHREMAPAEYVARHGQAMRGFTYDDYTYTDPQLEAWLREVGRLLREGRS